MATKLLRETVDKMNEVYFDIEELNSLAYVLNTASLHKDLGCEEFSGALNILSNGMEKMNNDLKYIAERLNDMLQNEKQSRPNSNGSA